MDKLRFLLPFLVAGTLAACQQGSGSDGAPDGGDRPGATGPTISAAVKQGYAVPRSAYASAQESTLFCLGGVYFASVLGSGGQSLLTTGTLTQTTQGTLNFSYTANPNDRLRLVFANGQQTECVIQNMNGVYQGEDAEQFMDNFFSNAHTLSYTMKSEGLVDLTLSSEGSGGSADRTVAGTLVVDGETYTLDLAQQYSVVSSSDFGSATRESNETLTGTITAPGFSASISDSYAYKMVYVDNVAEQSDHHFVTAWTVGGTEYRLENGRIRKAFNNNVPVETDSYWIVQGTLYRNGTAISQVQAQQEASAIVFYVDTPEGRVELESISLL